MQEYGYISRLKREMKGKYSDEYINKCVEYAANLLHQNLPVIFDQRHLKEILNLYRIKPDCYHTFAIAGKGKMRIINAPSMPIKVRQQWVLKEILEKREVHPCCHGFVKGKSILTNAKMHMGSKEILNMDIKDFFPSINFPLIINIYLQMGYGREAAEALAMLCCHEGQLPQGAPTSPYLANLVLRDMDNRLNCFCSRENIIYTRYADDMTFSGNVPLEKFINEFRKIISSYSFQVNEEKTRVYKEPYRKMVTGLIVKEDRICIPKKFKRLLKQEIYYCQKNGVTQHLKNTGNADRVNFKEYLYGKAYYIKMVEPVIGDKLLNDLDSIAWEY